MLLAKTENFLRRQGKPLVAFISRLGEFSVFVAQTVYNCLTPPFYGRNFMRQVIDMGFYSLPVVGLTTIFAGMVIALQSYSGFMRFGAEGAVASVVLISVTRELAPVLSALMVAGRIGAAMAAEIGTMRVTEQIDALTTLSTNPFKYLVTPRIWAGLIVMPILVLIGDVIGILADMWSVFTSSASTRPTMLIRLCKTYRRLILRPVWSKLPFLALLSP